MHQDINHVMYADDIWLLALSALGLHKLLKVYYRFSKDIDNIFLLFEICICCFRPKI